ncbi:hypothetical protein L9F63_005359 [Diploptera punctata]|uniref:Ionotropic glutamate receptor C-terminal domain-containing protein n=1 Tax=Diploptera punctata TaxID=6984 RepID=A0AAD7ZDA8_DIPPU|nr:hypothetical protein L9F63_005359 [Diploptera punctata]
MDISIECLINICGDFFFVMFFLTTLITVVIEKVMLQRSKLSMNDISYAFYSVWAVIISVSVPEMPKTLISRIIFFMWVFYSLIMSTISQSFFTKLLSENNEIYIRTFLVNESDIENFFEIKDSALLTTDLNMNVKFQTYYKKMLKPCYFKHNHFFMIISPYYEPYNYKLMQYLKLSHFEDKVKHENDENEDYFTFSMLHLKIVFFLFIYGNVISFIVFLFEIFSFKMK